MPVDATEAVRVILLIKTAGVPFAFIGDARANLERGFFRDIDILTAEENLEKVRNCLADKLGREGYVLFNVIANEYCQQLYWRHPDSRRVLHVDLLPRLTYRGLPYLHIPLEGASIDESCGFPAIADADVALYMMLRQVLWNGEVARHVQFVSEAIKRQRAYMAQRLQPAVGPRLAACVLDAVAGAEMGCLKKVRRRFVFRAFTRHPVSSFKNVSRDFLMLARRFKEHPGLVVVLLGADGSGKTSVIRRLSEPENAFMNVIPRHLFPGWLPLGGRGTVALETVEHPHDARNRTPLLSAAKLLAWFVEFTLGWTIKLGRPLEAGSLILFDRYAYDILVDPRRYRFGGPAWLARALTRAVPEPDVCIALDAPAQTLISRKREISLEELERQRTAYVELVGSMHNGRVVDAAQPLEDVAADIQEIILDLLAKRAEKRRAGLQRVPIAKRERG